MMRNCCNKKNKNFPKMSQILLKPCTVILIRLLENIRCAVKTKAKTQMLIFMLVVICLSGRRASSYNQKG